MNNDQGLISKFNRVNSIKEGMEKSKVTVAVCDDIATARLLSKRFVDSLPPDVEHVFNHSNQTILINGNKVIFTSDIDRLRGLDKGSSIYFMV